MHLVPSLNVYNIMSMVVVRQCPRRRRRRWYGAEVLQSIRILKRDDCM